MRSRSWLAEAIALLVPILGTTVLASEVPKVRSGAVGLKYGKVGSTTVEYIDRECDTGTEMRDIKLKGSYSFGVFFEQRVYRDIRVIFSVDISDIKPQWRGLYSEDSDQLLDLAIGAKATWANAGRTAAIRPGFAVGYGVLPKVGFLDDSHYTTIKTYTEFTIYTSKGTGFLLEIGGYWAVNGSDGTYDLSAGPALLMRFGLVL